MGSVVGRKEGTKTVTCKTHSTLNGLKNIWSLSNLSEGTKMKIITFNEKSVLLYGYIVKELNK